MLGVEGGRVDGDGRLSDRKTGGRRNRQREVVQNDRLVKYDNDVAVGEHVAARD